MVVLVHGASGFVGARVLEVLAGRGLSLVAAGRDVARVERAVRRAAAGVRLCPVDLGDRTTLVRALRGVAVVVNCAGPAIDVGTSVLEAAIAAGVHYVDVSTEASHLGQVYARFDADARRAGVVVAAGIGAKGALGDWGAAVLAATTAGSGEVRIAHAHAARAYLRPSVAGWRAAAGQGFYRSVPGAAEFPTRRRFSFPPPFGVGTGLMVVGPEDVSLLRTLPDAQVSSFIALAPGHVGNAVWAQWEVRTGHWVPTLAKVLQTGWGRFHLDLYFPGPARNHPRDTFATVIEYEHSNRVQSMAIVARDQYEVTAHCVALAVERLLAGPGDLGGARSPSQLVEPAGALRELERRGVVRVLASA